MPLILSQLKSMFRLFSDIKLTMGLFLFVLTNIIVFKNLHPWNKSPDYLRNLLLLSMEKFFFIKLLFFIAIAVSVISFYLLKLKNKSDFIFFPLTAFALASQLLIEPRYTILPFTLLLLIWQSENNRILRKILAFCIILSLAASHLVLYKYFHL